jgi:hypothetical protein
MCGLPVFPPKPKRENPARTRRTLRLIAAWVRGALLARYTRVERSGPFPNAGGEPQ